MMYKTKREERRDLRLGFSGGNIEKPVVKRPQIIKKIPVFGGHLASFGFRSFRFVELRKLKSGFRDLLSNQQQSR